ncbi:MAG: hypothetical protein H6537_00525 [Bacteroidales bacterium]|nr:hypothetical protein [Bacteroidales bacterium]HPD95942.1 hypothetical protein [Tenuifilaceae bacterium]HRX30934.1 hypothetical protein [Tenuifilaceae bacterium]
MEQNRKNYQEKAHKILDDIFNGIDNLENNFKDSSKEINSSMDDTIRQMKAEGEKLKGKFKEMCDANSDSWEDIRNGFEKAANSLHDAFTSARNNYKHK